MDPQQKCPTVLLPDIPASEDGFDAHSSIANTIAELIYTEKGGKYIGLEGDWGSGKSTVINLLEKSLSNDDQIKIVKFDAWSHQGDPLRRTFLETLMKALCGWINKKRWIRRSQELAGCRETIHTKKTPVLFFWGKALIVSLLLLTQAPTLLKAWLDRDLVLWRPGLSVDVPGTLELIFGLLFLTLPFIIIGIRSVCQRDSKKQKLENNKRLSFLVDPEDNIDPWCILSNQYDSRTTSSTIKSPDPTSVEFNKMFIKLMNEALINNGRRVVIVLDNLDRLPRTEALSMWSTMQTFLSISEFSSKEWFYRVWVIVPYDRSGINKLWEDGEITKDDVASHFLDKTFQIVFQVPPLSLSDWRKYLRKHLLESAFPKHNRADFDDICNLYATSHEMNGRIPTPRELILFVNQIGALHRRYSEYEGTDKEISLVHIAHYVLIRRVKDNTVDKIIKDLRQQGKLTLEIDSRFGKEYRVAFAALVLGVDIIKARQLLLRGPIEDALTNRKTDDLHKYVDYPGFWDVLVSMQISSIIANDSRRLTNFAYSIANMGVDIGELRKKRFWICRELDSAVFRIEQLHSVDEDISAALEAILRITQSPNVASHILDIIQSFSLQELNDEDINTSGWVDTLAKTLSIIDDLGYPNTYDQGVKFPSQNAGQFIDMCSRFYEIDKGKRYWSIVRTEFTASDIAQAIAEKVPDIAFLRAIYVITAAGISVDWDKITLNITNLMSDTIPSESVRNCLQALWHIRQEPVVKETLTTMVMSGSILEDLSAAINVNDIEATSWCLFIYLHELAYGNNIHIRSTPINPTLAEVMKRTDPSFVNVFINLLMQFNELNILLDVPPLKELPLNLLYSCLRNIANGEIVKQLLTPKQIIIKWSRVRAAFTSIKTRKQLFNQLATQSGFVKAIMDQGFDAQLCDLYSAIIDSLADWEFEFVIWCVKGLQSVKTEAWLEQLHKGGSIIDLMILLLERGEIIKLGEPYVDAMSREAEQILKTNEDTMISEDIWMNIFIPLTPDQKKEFRRYILQILIDSESQGNLSYYKRYHNELLDDSILAENVDTVALLFVPIIKLKIVYKLRWLRDVFTRYPNILYGYRGKPSGIAKYFKDLVADTCTYDHSQTIDLLLRDIAMSLGVEPKKKKGLRDWLRSRKR